MRKKIILSLVLSALMILFCSCDGKGQTEDSEKDNKNMLEKRVELPNTIEKFVETVNSGNNKAFLDFFDKETGIVNDWGRRYVGQDAIKGWSDKEFIGAKGKITPQKVEQKDNEVTLWAGWKSNFYTGDSKFIFSLDGEKIKEMRIPQR